MKNSFTLFALITTFFSFSQALQLEDIMKGNEFIGHQPENHRWSVDGKTMLFDWNPKNEIGNSTYFWNTNSGTPQKVTTTNPIYDIDYDASQKQFDVIYYTNQGVLYSYTKATKKTKKVLHSTDRITAIVRSINPNRIFFQQNRNVYQLKTQDF